MLISTWTDVSPTSRALASLPAATPVEIKRLIKQADRACAFFEAVQLAGFAHAESLELFGNPPPGYALQIDPLPPGDAQAQFLRRFAVLSEAAGYRASGPADVAI